MTPITNSLEFQIVTLTNRDSLKLKLDLVKSEPKETNILITKRERNSVLTIFKIFTAKLKEKRELPTTSISIRELRLEISQIILRQEDHSELTNENFDGSKTSWKPFI